MRKRRDETEIDMCQMSRYHAKERDKVVAPGRTSSKSNELKDPRAPR